MAPIRNVRTVALGIVAISLTWSCDFLAAGPAPSQATLYVYTYATLSAEMQREAANTFATIYAAAGVNVRWIDVCTLSGCPGAASAPRPEPAPLTVVIAAEAITPRHHRAQVMGETPSNSAFAYIYLNRIKKFALERDLVMSVLLGHVIAHEVGHILLQDGHAGRGIMRARWDEGDLLALRLGRLGFTDMQSLTIRSRLAAMESGSQ